VTAVALGDALRDALRDAWPLDERIVFLNHGSFGACPLAVLEHQQALRLRLEQEPVRFFVRELESAWDEARAALATFVGCDPDDLVSVPNATVGVNAVLASLRLEAGDEVLITNQVYPACRNAVTSLAERTGARVVELPVPFPPPGEDELDEALRVRITDRTRVALLDHVTSPTGTILPLERWVPMLKQQGVRVLIDGAHAPGMVPLDIDALGADFYVGNCHKWLCAPKGAGFLHVAHAHRDEVHPQVVSLGYRSPRKDRSAFLVEFGWSGTNDPTAFLAVPFAIRYVGSLHPEGWRGIRARNHALMVEAVGKLGHALGLEPWQEDTWYGSMVALPLPNREDAEPCPPRLDALQDQLFEGHGIEVPVITWPRHPRRMIRMSAHLYNGGEDFDALANALRALAG
jgi:isopenicillin-N epimerase